MSMDRKQLASAREYLETVIAFYGGQEAFGRKLAEFQGRKKPYAQRTISLWLNETAQGVSLEVAFDIERMSRKKFLAHRLRPDRIPRPKNHRAPPVRAKVA